MYFEIVSFPWSFITVHLQWGGVGEKGESVQRTGTNKI